VGASTGFGSGPPLVAWFGLGAERSVDVRVTALQQVTDRRVRTDRSFACLPRV
jgi:hypothetical protein